MYLEYSTLRIRRRSRILAGITMVIALFFLVLATSLFSHYWAVLADVNARKQYICPPNYDYQAGGLRVPVEQTIPAGFFFGGVAAVACIQGIRFFNGSRTFTSTDT